VGGALKTIEKVSLKAIRNKFHAWRCKDVWAWCFSRGAAGRGRI